jgi:hypothetical protein
MFSATREVKKDIGNLLLASKLSRDTNSQKTHKYGSDNCEYKNSSSFLVVSSGDFHAQAASERKPSLYLRPKR